MGAFIDTLRFLAVKACRLPVLCPLCSGYYRLAGLAFVSLCKRHPVIKSAYIRQRHTSASRTPGLSDIDLTFVLNSESSEQSALLEVRQFHREIGLLRKIFPILVDIEVLHESHFSNYIYFGVMGYSSKHWQRVYGDEVRGFARNEEHVTDSLYRALVLYEEHVLPKVFSPLRIRDLNQQLLERIRNHIRRDLHWADCGENGQITPGRVEAQLVKETLHLLTLAARKSGHVGASPSTLLRPERTQLTRCDLSGLSRLHGLGSEFLKTLTSYYPLLESVVTYANGSLIFVISDDTDSPGYVDLIAFLSSINPRSFSTPLILTRSLFRYYYYRARPEYFLNLANYGELFFGDDPISNVEPPSEADCARSFRSRGAWVLMWPWLERVMADDNSARAAKEVKARIYWALSVLLFLEHGVLRVRHDDIYDYCKDCYPELCGGLKSLQSYLESSSLLPNFFIHRLLWDIAQRLHSYYSRYRQTELLNNTMRST